MAGKFPIALAAATLAMVSACTEVDPARRITGTSASGFGQVPTVVEIGGRQITMSASLVRDTQPTAPGTTGGGTLTANILLTTSSQAGIPSGMRADSLWVVQGGQLWETRAVSEGQPVSGGSSLSYVARGGPQFPVGATADVIVQLIDAEFRVRRLRTTGVLIQRVE